METQKFKTCKICNPIVCKSYDFCKSRTTWTTNAFDLDLIKRTNYDDIIWSGWERTGYEFKLTVFGKALAERFDVERKEVKL